MSIKRSKEVTRRRPSDRDDVDRKKGPERVYLWDDDVAARAAEPFVSYAGAHRYAKDVLVVHPVFGAGVVTKVEGTKIEVLFRDGAKKLAHNPAGSDAPTTTPPLALPPPKAAPAAAPAEETPEAPPAPTGLPERAMAGVLWAFVRTPYPSLPEFVTAVIANHVKIIGNHEGRFVPSALVIPAPQISVSYRAVRGDNPQAVVRSTTLVADDPTGFRQGELLWKLHQALVKENLADHPFFEGLTLSNRDDDPPSYLLLQGS